MKLTKKMLKEWIQQELKEFTASSGGSGARTKTKTHKTTVASKRGTKKSAKTAADSAIAAYNTARQTYQDASDAYTTALADFRTKDSRRTALASRKYKSQNKARGVYVRSDLKEIIERIEKNGDSKVIGISYDGTYNLELILEEIPNKKSKK